MKIQVHAPMVSNPESLVNKLTGQVQRAFARFSSTLTAIELHLRDENGPRGGDDKGCTIRLRVPGRPDVVVRETRKGVVAAATAAIERARHALSRSVRKQASRRGSPARLVLAEVI